MNIGLVAHDARKSELVDWVTFNNSILSKHNLFATGTTGRLIKEITIQKPISILVPLSGGETRYVDEHPFEHNVTCLLSGPLGGDQQIGAMIAEGRLDVLIFFCDNLVVQGHQNDVSALTRLASLYNIPFAVNRTTADFILTSWLFDNSGYKRVIPPAIDNYKNRKL